MNLRCGALLALAVLAATVCMPGIAAAPSTEPAPSLLAGQAGDLESAAAYWLSEDALAWAAPAASEVRLFFSDDAGLLVASTGGLVGGNQLVLRADGLVDGELAKRFRHLSGLPLYRVQATDKALVPSILRQQVAIAAVDASGNTLDATGVQIAGVLDQLYANDLPMGVSFPQREAGEREAGARLPLIRLWAPTARSVKLHLHADGAAATAADMILIVIWMTRFELPIVVYLALSIAVGAVAGTVIGSYFSADGGQSKEGRPSG